VVIVAQMGDELEKALRAQRDAFQVILEEISGQIDGIADGHKLLNQKFDSLDVKVDRLEEKVDGMDLRLSSVEGKVDRMLNGTPKRSSGKKRR
jgi:hypothetical protein